MKADLRIFTTAEIMADSLAEEFYRYVNEQLSDRLKLNIALSGGSTPALFLEKLSLFNQERKSKIDWGKINFYWGDERCVPPSDRESNYGEAKKILLDFIDIPEKNIFRIEGELPPEEAANKYSDIIRERLNKKNNLPVFDWIFLGIGSDGHTSSIFPDNKNLFKSESICAVTENPESKQKRVTLTGSTINHARRVTFIASGQSKQEVLEAIHNKMPKSKNYPASLVSPIYGKLDWYMDSDAADLI